jgi:hypothetical protein
MIEGTVTRISCVEHGTAFPESSMRRELLKAVKRCIAHTLASLEIVSRKRTDGYVEEREKKEREGGKREGE